MRYIFYSLMVIVFFIGCSSSSTITKNTYPQWYINPPVNTSNYLFAEGIGVTKEEAKQNALNTVASGLIVNLSSTTQIDKEIYSNGVVTSYNKSVQQNIQTNVQNIEFSNPKIIQSQYINSEFIVLLQINKQELYKKYLNRFKQTDKHINTVVNQSSKDAPLEAILEIERIKPQIQTNTINALILNALNNDFLISKYEDNYNSILNTQKNIIKNSPLFITSNSKEKVFLNHLSKKLNVYGFKISQKEKSIKVRIHNDIVYSKARGWNIAKVTSTIQSFSNNTLLSTNIVSSIGRSSTSKQLALQSAGKDFNTKINLIPIENILF